MVQTAQDSTFQQLETINKDPELEVRIKLSLANEVMNRELARKTALKYSSLNNNKAVNNSSSTVSYIVDQSINSFLNFPPTEVLALPHASLLPLQEWEGRVTELMEDKLTALLVVLTEGDSYESEEAIIPLVEFSEEDVSQIQVGSVFRWVIGCECSNEGSRKRVSQIVLRNIPRTTEEDFKTGREWANKVSCSTVENSRT